MSENNQNYVESRTDMQSEEIAKLIFVYNADGGKLNAIKDYFHKILSPKTYDCNLCGVSFGLGGMKKDWKNFIEELPLPVEFLHRDEWIEQYPKERKEFPSAWIKQGGKLELLITSEEMDQPKSVEDLIKLTNLKLIQKNVL